jgi:hypothetical protein
MRMITTAAMVAATTALVASVSTAQAALKGPGRTAFVQSFMARCLATYTGPAHAASNYCNCGAQGMANSITDGDVASGAARGVLSARHGSMVTTCRARHFR